MSVYSYIPFLINFDSSKTVQMLSLKEKLLEEIENSRKEDRCLSDYRSEVDMLMQEKMAHVEELRQIHADINAVSVKSFMLFSETW